MNKPLCLASLALLLSPFSAPLHAQQSLPALLPAEVQMQGTKTAGVFHDPFDSDSNSEAAPMAKVRDPLEKLNRSFYKFNEGFYFWIIKPVATGYKFILPRTVREHIALFLKNTRYPIRLGNTLLQGRLKGAGIETGRFVLNTTVGLGGFFDPATKWKIEAEEADFDQTLGFYRIPTGCYLVWPVLGPSSLRATVGMAGDVALSPLTYVNGVEWAGLAKPVEVLNTASLRLGEYEQFKKSNLDPYVSMRSVYVDWWKDRDRKEKPEKAEKAPKKPDPRRAQSGH